MKSSVNKSNVSLLTTFLLLISSPCLVNADFTVGGNWDVVSSFWCGPLVVDSDLDGEKEIIITDESTIRIYDPDGNLERTINLPEDLYNNGYRFRSIPSVGQLNETDHLEIVVTCVNNNNFLVSCQASIVG
jgi:hypothetical protein